ncbi:MAG: 4-hydroxybenzoate polyprenyltransferase [Frankiaceae bacterium]|jgi:4-hydroxybenzoate polyprenyltransferase|nr:4-hydroxybenzoate polyprenyltransferase [Frankiaceae bacterium]
MSTALAEPVAMPGGVRGFLRLVAIEHSVFALPFAYIAALTAMRPDVRWGDLALVTVAMVAARTFAMAANRVIDRELDGRNPRTASRELVTGTLPLRTAVAGMAVSLAVFLAAAAALSPLCLALAPVALVPLTVYPYAKRFTWLCHFVLGLAQAIAPVGAWVAVTGTVRGWWPAICLGIAVGSWIAGFDLIYACQDVESDRREGVHSLPARFGARTALAVSVATHAGTVALLVAFGRSAHLGTLWWAGVALTAAALAYEHRIVRPDDLSRVNRAFFTVNGFVGVGLFGFALADLVAHGLHA